LGPGWRIVGALLFSSAYSGMLILFAWSPEFSFGVSVLVGLGVVMLALVFAVAGVLLIVGTPPKTNPASSPKRTAGSIAARVRGY
jgi:hypothetical protein